MLKDIYLAGGCFWGMEAYFRSLSGVADTDVGYANSNIDNPSYEDLCCGRSTAAETLKLTYDDDVTNLYEIMKEYIKVVDITSLNKQGADTGIQYRAGVYSKDEKDLDIINEFINSVKENYSKKPVLEILPLENYFSAEEYHQDYLIKNPKGYCHIKLS